MDRSSSMCSAGRLCGVGRSPSAARACGCPGALALPAVLTKTVMRAAWSDAAVEESNLSVQIAALRKQLGPAPDGGEWIATIPRVGYRFVGGLSPQPTTDMDDVTATDLTEDEHRPSIAVLPFTNLSDEREQEYFADGVTDDIITALSRMRWLFVIARNSSFAYKGKLLDVKQVAHDLSVQYLLEGSVRKSGRRVRISTQLIDARSSNHIWAERYDLELTEVFAVQDEIAERVARPSSPNCSRPKGPSRGTSHRQHDGLGSSAARHLAFPSSDPRGPPASTGVVSPGPQARPRTS